MIKASQGLVLRVYSVKKEDGGEMDFKIASSFENLPEEKSIELGVSSMAKPYLLALKEDYTEFELDIALKLKSKYSKRIYEMVCEHKEQGKFVISVEDLKVRFYLLDPKTGEDKYPGWHMFAKHILEIPQKELNEIADLTFNYIPKKTGKKFTHIEFTILPNSKKEAKYEEGLFGTKE